MCVLCLIGLNGISRTNVDSIARFVYNNYKIIKENLEGYK